MNVKPKDLAIVIPPSKNVGAIVRVVKLSDRDFERGVEWEVETSGRALLTTGGRRKKCTLPDAWLRPVSGLPIDEETRDEVPASCN